ncbi:hypothetical protein D9M68_722940 [compost metagenome]
MWPWRVGVRKADAKATISYPLPPRRWRMLPAADDRMSGIASGLRRAHEKGRHAPAFSFAVAYFAGVSAGLSPAAGAGVAGAAGAEGTDASGLAGSAGTEPAPGTDEAPDGAAGVEPGTCGTERSAG